MPIESNVVFRVFRRLFPALVVIVAISKSSAFGHALPSTPVPMSAACLYQELQSRGLGSDVKVTEVDGTVITGTLVEVEIDSFEMVPKNAVHAVRIPDSKVAELDHAGLPRVAKVVIGALLGVVVVIGLVAVSTGL
jgi:hypothetical protein